LKSRNNPTGKWESKMSSKQEFRDQARSWLRLETQMSNDREGIKKRREECNHLKQCVLNYMKENKIGQCMTQDGKYLLVLKERERKIRPKRAEIITKISHHLSITTDKAKSLYQYVFENCETERVCEMKKINVDMIRGGGELDTNTLGDGASETHSESEYEDNDDVDQ